jgi:hypothetical protein
MGKARYPPYSPGLAPADFFVFGHVKQLLEEPNFAIGIRFSMQLY